MHKIKLLLSLILCAIVEVLSDGELVILKASDQLKFNDSEPLRLSHLANIFSAACGYTVDDEIPWRGFEIKNPFAFCNALVVFEIPNIHSLKSPTGQTIPLEVDDDVTNTWNIVHRRTAERYLEDDRSVLKVNLGDELQTFGNYELSAVDNCNDLTPVLSLNHLSPLVDKDNEFILELNKIHRIMCKVLRKEENKSGAPVLVWLTLRHFASLIKLHGQQSKSVIEARNLLNEALAEYSKQFETNFLNKALVVALVHDEKSSQRSKREATTDKAIPLTEASLNVADDYDEDFPVIFNIVLWFTISLLFAVIAICMVIGNMDPGRDSIIYRMTSTRMKKDN